jgi:hypothetical protein
MMIVLKISDELVIHCIGRELLQPRAFTKLVVQGENPVHRREAVELDMGLFEVHRFSHHVTIPEDF